MKKHFYTHIISIETVHIELKKLGLPEDEHIHLSELVESSLHHTIVDTVLSELPEEHKKTFLQHLSDENHEKIWEMLGDKASEIEKKIKSTGESLLKRLHEDIKESK